MEKSALLSKTFWLGIITALAPLLPGVSEFVTAHLQEMAIAWGVLSVVLRFVTKDKVKLLPW